MIRPTDVLHSSQIRRPVNRRSSGSTGSIGGCSSMSLTSTLIPTNWTACVAGANYNTGCFYLLVKGGQTMIMFTHPVYKGDAPFDYPGLERIAKDFDDGMELIQEVLDKL